MRRSSFAPTEQAPPTIAIAESPTPATGPGVGSLQKPARSRRQFQSRSKLQSCKCSSSPSLIQPDRHDVIFRVLQTMQVWRLALAAEKFCAHPIGAADDCNRRKPNTGDWAGSWVCSKNRLDQSDNADRSQHSNFANFHILHPPKARHSDYCLRIADAIQVVSIPKARGGSY